MRIPKFKSQCVALQDEVSGITFPLGTDGMAHTAATETSP